MKKLIFLLLLFACLLFAGCGATADMEYGIDADNNAYTKLRVDVNAGDLLEADKNFLQSDLISIVKHYRDELGFECEYDYFAENKNKAYIILTKTIPCDSFEEAFENLKTMLCDEKYSAFSEVSCELSDTTGKYAYRINGQIDLHRVIENSNASGVPKGVADYIGDQLEDCSFSVTLAFPENTEIFRLSHTEPTEIAFEGKALSKADILPSFVPKLNDNLLNISVIVIIAVTFASGIGIIIGVKLIKNGKKKDKDTI